MLNNNTPRRTPAGAPARMTCTRSKPRVQGADPCQFETTRSGICLGVNVMTDGSARSGIGAAMNSRRAAFASQRIGGSIVAELDKRLLFQ